MKTIKTNLLIILLIAAAFGQDRIGGGERLLTLESFINKDWHGAGDTVVVEIAVGIPRGYNLYANPLGPGIGRPLALFVDRRGNDSAWNVAWGEARKSAPRRYRPPAGDWVWAYESKAYFFITGVVDNVEYGAWSAVYDVVIDALICRTDCIPLRESVSFVLNLSSDIAGGPVSRVFEERPAVFPAASNWRARYARAERMEFKVGRPADGLLQFGAAGDGELLRQLETALNLGGLPQLDLGGQSSPGNNAATTSAPHTAWNYSPLESRRSYNLLTAVLFALLAGLALNLTPCVFPVLGIRVLSFAESARESRRRAVARSVVFAGGIVSVFLLLAGFAAFAGLSWGQQFQNPGILVGVIAMIFLFALGMFDFYTVTVPPALSNAERKAGAGFAGDFLKGAAATVMATPCGGPFLGALLAWALLQKPLTIFLLFAVMGAGMALPYVLLSSSKRLFNLLPKPGRWIEDFKYAMGFVLLAFAINMMRSLDQRLTVMTVGVFFSILCAASINKRFAPFGVSTTRRIAMVLISATVLTAGAVFSFVYLRIDTPLLSDASSEQTAALWSDFSPQALRAAHEEGRNVIVNFTAAWCTNCKLNKIRALNIPAAQKVYAEKEIVLLSADITNYNPEAQSLLHHLGSRSIPFLAIFSADSPNNPIIMRDIISKERYLAAIRGLPATVHAETP
ncbi:MAG: thioredoxin family protein [Chitinispirillales bacterium]|jgi:thiol:disulfide interchange protein|nr:thioredoxin family protein [Chitinispirillales bacterium]